MKEIIETLNHTSPARVIFYCLIFLFSLGITVDGITAIIKGFRKK